MSHILAGSKPTLAQHATSSHQYWNCIRIAADFVKAAVGGAEMAIVLGSGLMDFTDKFQQNPPPKMIDYASIPYMPGTNVPGHSGKIFVGDLATKGGVSKVMCFAGRVHAYEGWAASEFNFIVRLAHACGVKVLVLTNSAGGALHGMTEGSIMMIDDHIRFSGINPLADVSDDPRFGRRHAASSTAYSKRIAAIVRAAADKLHMPVLSGTYCWTSGPSYETPAEVQAGKKLSVNSLGGAFGMSTVPEILAAHNLGMEVFGVSLCTNLAAGLGDKELTHGDVKEVAEVAGPRFQNLLLEMFANLDVDPQLAKRVLPVDYDAAFADVQTLGQVTSRNLYPLAGWTPSLRDVYEGVARVAAANGASSAPLAAGVIFFGGRHQRAVQSAFLQSLSNVKTLPLRELTGAFTRHADMLSSYARSGLLVLGSLPSGGKRVAVVVSNDGNGVVGLSAAESSLLVQVLQGLGVSSVLGCGVAVDTQNRGVGGVDANAPARAARHVLLVEDVLDRTIDPLPLSVPHLRDLVAPVAAAHTPTFDSALNLALERALLAVDGSAKPTVQVGSYLAFQGPMLPSEAELNIAFHAGAVTAAGVSNMQFTGVAKEFGIRVAVLLHTVANVNDIPAADEDKFAPPADKHAGEEERAVASVMSNALLSALVSEASVVHVAQNLRSEAVARFLAAPVESAASSSGSQVSADPVAAGLAGYGPVTVTCHPDSFAQVSASAEWIAAKLNGTQVKSFVMAEGMVGGLFAPEAGFQVEWDCSVLDVPHFAAFVGLEQQLSGAAVPRSGSCFPYDPRVVLSSWRLQLVRLNGGSAVLLLVNQADRTGLVPQFHGLNYMVRVAKLLQPSGVTNLLLLPAVASCDASLAPGSLVLVKDHMNLTGLNPLFGENTPEFGPRFNDMSVVYRPNSIAAFTAQAAGKDLPTTITAQVANPSAASLSEAALARSVNATTLTAGFAPLATMAKHTELLVTAMAYVYRTAGSSDDASIKHNATAAVFHTATPPSVAVLSAMRGLVAGAIDTLHDAGLVHNASVQAATA